MLATLTAFPGNSAFTLSTPEGMLEVLIADSTRIQHISNLFTVETSTSEKGLTQFKAHSVRAVELYSRILLRTRSPLFQRTNYQYLTYSVLHNSFFEQIWTDMGNPYIEIE